MIERRRKRPRVRSISLRTLWWLIHREASLRVCVRFSADEAPSWRRRWWLTLSRSQVRAQVDVMLFHEPERRHYP